MSSEQTWHRFKNILGGLGIAELIYWAPEYLAELVRHQRDSFDRRHGTDTNRPTPVSDLGAVGSNRDSAELYWPVREALFRTMMAAVDLPLDRFTFVDIGCGKGRAMLLAAELPFQRVVGVEFSPALCRVAEANLALKRSARPAMPPSEVHCQDATTWDPPAGALLVFLADPFGPAVLQPVIEKLVANLRADPRPCRIAYYFPTHRRVLEAAGFRPVAEQGRNWRMTYPWVVFRGPTG